MTTTTRIPPSPCLNCGREIDAASAPEPLDFMPNSGDVSICFYCGHVSIFDDDLKLREPTGEEIVEIAGDPDLVAYQNMRAEFMRGQGGK